MPEYNAGDNTASLCEVFLGVLHSFKTDASGVSRRGVRGPLKWVVCTAPHDNSHKGLLELFFEFEVVFSSDKPGPLVVKVLVILFLWLRSSQFAY